MDDPTRQCENDTGIETRLPGLLVPSGSPSFCCIHWGPSRFFSLEQHTCRLSW